MRAMRNYITQAAIILALLSFPGAADAEGGLSVEFEESPLFESSDLLPGSDVTRSVDIENRYEIPMEIYTATDNEVVCSGSSCLEDVLLLSISSENNTQWEGTLAEFYTDSYHIGSLSPGEERRFNYTITFPPNTGNEHRGATTGFDLLVHSADGEIASDRDETTEDGTRTASGSTGSQSRTGSDFSPTSFEEANGNEQAEKTDENTEPDSLSEEDRSFFAFADQGEGNRSGETDTSLAQTRGEIDEASNEDTEVTEIEEVPNNEEERGVNNALGASAGGFTLPGDDNFWLCLAIAVILYILILLAFIPVSYSLKQKNSITTNREHSEWYSTWIGGSGIIVVVILFFTPFACAIPWLILLLLIGVLRFALYGSGRR